MSDPALVSVPHDADADLPQHSRPLGLKRFGLAMLIAYMALVGAIAIGTTALLARDRKQELERNNAELLSLVRALDEHVTRSFEQVDTVLQSMASQLADGDDPRHGGKRPDELAYEWLRGTPPAARLQVFGADGSLLASTDSSRIASSDRIPTANALARTRMGELQIGRPARDRAGAPWLITLQRPFYAVDGKQAGRVVGAVTADYFQRFYREVRITPDDAIAILGRDGTLLVRLPSVDAQIGNDFSRNPLFAVPAPHATETRTGVSPLDGRQRIVVTRALLNYPLVVQVSRPENTALRGFHASSERIIWATCVLAALLGILAWLAFEDVRRRELARRTLHRLARSLELRVRQRTAELETSNQELMAFSYSVSHDLRAPLRAINGFSHALREDYAEILDDTGRDYLDRISRASIRMGVLIDELLKLASVARQPLDLKQIDLTAMAEDITRDLRGAQSEREVSLSIQPEMTADGDETLIRDVLGNLLDNAWKFTREKPQAQIEVGMRPSGDYQLFWVRDNGVGFDMNYASRLFQPFQQLHVGQGYTGAGIGLASARRIVERHGGKIWAESKVGRGTTVFFTLPPAAAVIRKRRESGAEEVQG